ncbi:MAG: LCP family protein [Acidimicrobiales bacterium]
MRSRKGGGPARRTHRLRRRLLVALAVVVVLIPIVGGAGWWYVNHKLGQIHTIAIQRGLLHGTRPGRPFNVLLIGSDSRQFEKPGSSSSQFGSASAVTGQRSDVVIIARVVPATKQIYMLSIPRDLYVNIPGKIPYISGMNRINAAFNSGPSLLIETLKADFGIGINHFAEINFAGFQSMVDAVGGIHVDFPDQLTDAYSGLGIYHTGCQLIHGAQSLAFVRSRHLQYKVNGVWTPDYGSDWSRIRRQDIFFHALLKQVKNEDLNPIAMNNLLGAVVKNIVIDSTMSKSGLLGLAYGFRGTSPTSIHTEVLPTAPDTLPSGAEVLQSAQPYDAKMVASFLAEGTGHRASGSRPKAASPTTTATGNSASTTTTTAPNSSNVVFDKQAEPWNGSAC